MKAECGEPMGIFGIPQQREYQTSEEDESRSSGGGGGGSGGSCKRMKTSGTSNAHDGASIEVVRRPRGRPPGSKNKPKPPVIVARETTDASMHPHVLEVPGGCDVVDAIARFARRRNSGLCILTGIGTVANVTLRQLTTSTTAVAFHGRFDILSISATFFPWPCSSATSQPSNDIKVLLAGAQGQIVGGAVVGSLLAAGTVVIVAASFSSPSFHRLNGDDEISAPAIASGEVVSENPGHHQNSMDGMNVYTCHMTSDVIWAPTPRQPY